MSLIKCPECGAEKVSSLAAACPHCGFPVAEQLRIVEEEKRKQAMMEQQKQEELERRGSGKFSVAFSSAYSFDDNSYLKIIHDGKAIGAVKNGAAADVPCEEPGRLLFYLNDEIFQSFHVEPGYDYVVELPVNPAGKPELTCTIREK